MLKSLQIFCISQNTITIIEASNNGIQESAKSSKINIKSRISMYRGHIQWPLKKQERSRFVKLAYYGLCYE